MDFKNNFSPIYFPTTFLVVDDDERFIHSMDLFLSHHNILHNSFSDPRRALEATENYQIKAQEGLTIEQEVLPIDEGDIRLRFKIENLFKEVYNPERFERISTLVVDYDMLSINGLDFIDSLAFPHVYRILLTGVVDEQLAIKAFNQKRIDQFFKKEASDFAIQFTEAIMGAQHQYFHSLSQRFLEALRTQNPQAALFQDSFSELLLSLIKKH